MCWLFWLVGLSTAMGGEHKPLCRKVTESDLVFEMRFEQRGHYPDAARDNEWKPPMSELLKTARTGVVATVFKGPIALSAPWAPGYGIGFTLGSDPAVWDAFFARKTFSKIYFLAKEAESYAAKGWAEESAGCSSSAHWSWCSEFKTLQGRIRECLDKATAP